MEDKTIQILSSQHKLIASLISDSIREGIRTPTGRRCFEQARKLMRKHLDLEHLRLYPKLESDTACADLCHTIDHHMSDVVEMIEPILEHHKDGYYPLEYQEDMTQVLEMLQAQFKDEEEGLFGLYPHH